MAQPISMHVSRDPSGLHDLRAWLRAELAARSALGNDRITEAVVMVSELASNVLLHTEGTGEVRLGFSATSVRIEVHDHGRCLPEMRPADPLRVGGQGLRIVDAWASEWGASLGPEGGKVVWLCLEV